VAKLGCQDVIAANLVNDPMLTAGNIKTFKKAYKELYDFAMVRLEYFSTCMHCRVVCLTPLPYAERDHSLIEEIRGVKSHHEWSPGACCQGEAHI
jgi:mRNA-degrading endonuclease YafQ of YafQ-DinJ toxin-antitoxin module